MMYTAMPPKSVGSPKRRTGIRGITLATNLSLAMMPAVMSLLIQPGRIAFAVTPWRASSTASARHSACSAALTEAGSETSQIWVCTLPGPADMVAAAPLFFSALRPQIETLQPCAFSACAMPRPIPPLPPVMTAVRPVRSKMLMGCFHLLWGAIRRAPSGGQMFWRKHGQARPENQIWAETPSYLPRSEIARKHKSRGSNAVQARHAPFRWPGRHSQARPSGGHERGLDGHAGRSRRGARCDRGQARRGALPRADGGGTRVLHRRQSAGPQQAR